MRQEVINKIQQRLSDELLKRGFHAPITVTEQQRKDGQSYLSVSSEPFNTTPVLFRSLTITDFGSRITKSEDGRSGKVWIGVWASFTTFAGGGNYVDLFHLTCGYDEAGVEDVRISS